MRPADFARHDWVYLPADWRDTLAMPLLPADEAALARWIERERPLVVARRQDGDAPDLLRLGLALPGKRRVGVALPAQAARLRRRAPYLLDAVEFGAAFWPAAMRDLATLIARAAADARIFGSFAWQFFAADPSLVYVTASSDIDLLLSPGPGQRLEGLLARLDAFATAHPAPRLDGEIALPGGDFVSWREYAARPKQILVKGSDGVSLRRIEDIDLLLAARAA
ncbi:MAG TPA: malonate decarboxylase holo-[acyl-carrier-protein] synthase [Rhodoblastus sp.]|nr:malonate decarboxylase holo-[acyl-carrier-protein] synthase [Rhodoblastus sp.]